MGPASARSLTAYAVPPLPRLATASLVAAAAARGVATSAAVARRTAGLAAGTATAGTGAATVTTTALCGAAALVLTNAVHGDRSTTHCVTAVAAPGSSDARLVHSLVRLSCPRPAAATAPGELRRRHATTTTPALGLTLPATGRGVLGRARRRLGRRCRSRPGRSLAGSTVAVWWTMACSLAVGWRVLAGGCWRPCCGRWPRRLCCLCLGYVEQHRQRLCGVVDLSVGSHTQHAAGKHRYAPSSLCCAARGVCGCVGGRREARPATHLEHSVAPHHSPLQRRESLSCSQCSLKGPARGLAHMSHVMARTTCTNACTTHTL